MKTQQERLELMRAAIDTAERHYRNIVSIGMFILFFPAILLIYSIIWDWWSYKPWAIWLIVFLVYITIYSGTKKAIAEMKEEIKKAEESL